MNATVVDADTLAPTIGGVQDVKSTHKPTKVKVLPNGVELEAVDVAATETMDE